MVVEAMANITVEADGEFSFSVYDSIDRDNVYMGSITASATEEFESEILITITGDLNGNVEDLAIEDVEIVNPISAIILGR